MHCIYCNGGWHHECIQPVPFQDSEEFLTCCCVAIDTGAPKAGDGYYKDGAEMLDVTSTGRKRAAQIKPIEDGMNCEWTGLKFAGGGVVPIVGCNGRPAKNIHHGPDKSTLNNSWDNLHRICPTCHNRWHSANDKYYGERPGEGKPFIPLNHEMKPHDPETKATIIEMFEAEVEWQTKKEKKDDSAEQLA